MVLFYIFFELTIGAKISKIENAVYQLKDSHARDEVKDKILSEMKKANEKVYGNMQTYGEKYESLEGTISRMKR